MVSVNINVTGLQELITRLNTIPEQISSFVSTTVMQVGDQMVTNMQADAPIFTGFLRDNIMITNSNEYAVQVASLAYYSIYLEMGTWKMDPQPFFFANAAAGGDALYVALSDYIKSIV